MKKFIYEDSDNKIEISLNGPYVYSSSDLNGYTLTQVTEKFPNTDGEEVGEVLYEPRSINIKGYLRANSKAELEKLRYNLHKIFDGKTFGRLRYVNGTNKFYANVKAEKSVEFGTSTGFMQTFIIYLKIHDFYWKRYRHNYADVNTVLSVKQDVIHGSFALPCVWTEIYNRKTVVNSGDVKVGMIITLKGKSGTENQGKGIEIINHSTNEHLTVKYDCIKDDMLVIDSKDFMVYLNNEKSLQLVDENNGSDFFCLQVGKNDIEIVNYCTDNELEVSLGFTEMYRSVPI